MPAFGPIGIRGMFGKTADIAEQMCLRWERFGPDAVIEVTEDMTRMTLDAIALCAFDYRFNSYYQREMHPFIGAMVDALAEAGARTRRPEVASKLLRTRRAYEDDLTLMRRTADALIAGRKRDPDAAQKKDLLGLMLQGKDPVTGDGLSDENTGSFTYRAYLVCALWLVRGLILMRVIRPPSAGRVRFAPA